MEVEVDALSMELLLEKTWSQARLYHFEESVPWNYIYLIDSMKIEKNLKLVVEATSLETLYLGTGTKLSYKLVNQNSILPEIGFECSVSDKKFFDLQEDKKLAIWAVNRINDFLSRYDEKPKELGHSLENSLPPKIEEVLSACKTL